MRAAPPRGAGGVLLLGPSGSGKSDLLLRLLDRGFALVADEPGGFDGRRRLRPAGAGWVAGGAGPRCGAVAASAIRAAGARRGAWHRRAAAAAGGSRGYRAAAGQDRSGLTIRGAACGPGVGLCARPGRPRRWSLCLTPRRVVLVTGLSGAGRSSILRVLEDLGYEAVDNPPLTLMEELVRAVANGRSPSASTLAAAASVPPPCSRPSSRFAAESGAPGRNLVFASADEDALLRRFTETRRPPSPGTERPGGGGQLPSRSN